MSLINDALKRASASLKKQPPVIHGTPLEPVQEAPSASNRGLAVIIAALIVAGGAGYGIWTLVKPDAVEVAAKSNNDAATKKADASAGASAKSAAPNSTSAPATPVAGLVSTPAPAPAPTGGQTLAGKVNAAKSVAATVSANNVAASEVAETVTTPPAVAASNEFPTLSVQGIYYRLSKPSARISGKTVYVGDNVDGATIKRIQRQSVTVEFAGQSKDLPLQR